LTKTAPSAPSLARNAFSGGGRFLVGALMALLVTPFALSRLGDARFGVWALAGVSLALLRMLDLGIARALTRRIAEQRGAGTLDEAGNSLATAGMLAVLIGGLATLLFIGLSEMLVTRVFAIPAALAEEARWVMMGTALVAFVELAFSPYPAALEGIGRMDLSNLVDGLVQRMFSPLGVVLVLSAGGGLMGLVAKNLLTALIAGLTCRRLLAAEAPELLKVRGWPGHRFHRDEARRLLRFGGHVQLINLGSALVEPFAKTLLGRLSGLDAVAVYELASRVAGQLGGACMALQNALFPAAAELSASGSRDALTRLYRRASRYLGAATLLLWGLVFALAEPFSLAWVGPAYPELPILIQILSLGWTVALLALPAFLVAQAAGRHRTSTTGGLTTTLVSLVSIGLLTPVHGLLGVATGVAMGLASGGIVTLLLFAREEGRGLWIPLPWQVFVAAGLGAASAGWLARTLPKGLAFVALSAALGLLVSFVLLFVFGALEPAERAALRGYAEAQRARLFPKGHQHGS
jgi:O-antigen/teichoic acid export membrane protein